MGWLELLFGKRNAKTIKTIQKTTAKLRAKPHVPTERGRPPLKWKKSQNGNDTAEIDGFRITVFEQDDGWTYCISEILDAEDIADGVEDELDFGDWFPTKAAAKRGALDQF